MPYLSDMIAATRGEELARVDSVGESGYVVGVYQNAAAASASNASTQLALPFAPNAADILEALPQGFVADSELPAVAPVPASVTPRQLRLWLVTNGLPLASIDAAIGTITNALDREKAKIEWEYATSVERANPLLLFIAEELDLGSEELDDAFREASRL